MRKIINGKKYDTETAEQLASYWNELSTRDFRHMTERLFRKKNGEYFLYGKGGPASAYAKVLPDGCGQKRRYIAMSTRQSLAK